MLTLAQVKASSVAKVAGVNVSDPEFTNYVNDAVRMLMELGNGGARGWWGTVQVIDGVAYDGCFVWPSNVVAVLAINSVAGSIPVKNHWYSFLNNPQDMCQEYIGKPTVEFVGQTCTFRSIASSPSLLRVSYSSADIGKKVTIYGTDSTGLELTSGGHRGFTFVLGTTDVTTALVAHVSEVVKDVTSADVHLYTSSADTALIERIATYRTGDTNPKFLYSHVVPNCASGCTRTIRALVKLGFQAVYGDYDLIPIDNIDAIKSMVQSIRSREGGDVAAANAHEKDALRRLVAQVNSRFPLEQTVAQVRPFGLSTPNRMTSPL